MKYKKLLLFLNITVVYVIYCQQITFLLLSIFTQDYPSLSLFEALRYFLLLIILSLLFFSMIYYTHKLGKSERIK